MRRRPALTRLLAALLLLQWGLAFGHCLRLVAPAHALTVEICTAQGIHRVVLPPEREDGAGHHDHAFPAGVCPACQGPAAAALPAPPVALVPPLLLAQAADPPPAPPSSPVPLPPRSCQPRGPPPTS